MALAKDEEEVARKRATIAQSREKVQKEEEEKEK